MNQPVVDGTATITVESDPEQRKWALFAHLSILAGGLLTWGWAASFGSFLGPLVIWLVKKDTMPFVADQAKEALNFGITLTILCVALLMLTILSLGVGAILTIPLFLLIGLGALVLCIIAAIKANEGVAYRYPLTLRLVK
jgi:uncharacterized Tic20 family protein